MVLVSRIQSTDSALFVSAVYASADRTGNHILLRCIELYFPALRALIDIYVETLRDIHASQRVSRLLQLHRNAALCADFLHLSHGINLLSYHSCPGFCPFPCREMLPPKAYFPLRLHYNASSKKEKFSLIIADIIKNDTGICRRLCEIFHKV